MSDARFQTLFRLNYAVRASGRRPGRGLRCYIVRSGEPAARMGSRHATARVIAPHFRIARLEEWRCRTKLESRHDKGSAHACRRSARAKSQYRGRSEEHTSEL